MFEDVDWQGSGGVLFVVPGGSGTYGIRWSKVHTGRRISIDPNSNIAKASAAFPCLLVAFALLLAVFNSTRLEAQELPPLSAGPRTVTFEELGALWYDPMDGRMWISVNYVFDWRVTCQSVQCIFKAPEPGILPAANGLALISSSRLGESHVMHFSYPQPVELGAVGPIAKSASDFRLLLSRGAMLPRNIPVFIVPEPSLRGGHAAFLLLVLRCIAHVRTH